MENRQADFPRTIARSGQLEAEARSTARQPSSRGEFFDDPEDQADMATMLQDDQIDFLDPEDEYEGENNGVAFEAGGEEQAINLNKQRPMR